MKLIRTKEAVNKIGSKSSKKPKSNKIQPNQVQVQKQNVSGTSKERKEVNFKCRNCGTIHMKGKCPAKGTPCKYCRKPDHWLKVCRRRLRRVNLVGEDEEQFSYSDSDEPLFIQTIDTINVNSVQDNKWAVNLNIAGEILPFCIGTGAKCNILVNSKFQRLETELKLEKSSKTLKSFTNHKIIPIGKITVPVKLNSDSPEIIATFEVIDLDQECVNSGELAEKLGLIRRIHKVSDFKIENDRETEDLSRDLPELVKTTVTLPGEYEIKIEENAKGVIHPPKRSPAAIREKAIKELEDMEANGFITPVDGPTEWVNSMVVSVRNDKVIICLDSKEVNKVVKREHHPMKTIEAYSESYCIFSSGRKIRFYAN